MLVERGLAPTRTRALALILAGHVRVNDSIITKAGAQVSEETPISLIDKERYVSRGGDKLQGALEDLKIDVSGRVCLDVGASTGGFTDCLLQHGASFVYAVDVGTHQLIDSLRQDPRVRSFEKTHILDFEPTQFTTTPTLATIDVSFISLTRVLPKVKTLLPQQSLVLAMVKPQFEVGSSHLKKGVVRSEEIREEAVNRVRRFAQELNFQYVSQAPARIKGPKGNQEYFLHLTT